MSIYCQFQWKLNRHKFYSKNQFQNIVYIMAAILSPTRHDNKNKKQCHKSQNAPVRYPTVLHSEQKCAHFCSELGIVGYGTGAFWDLWIRWIECWGSVFLPEEIHRPPYSNNDILHTSSTWGLELPLGKINLRQSYRFEFHYKFAPGCRYPWRILRISHWMRNNRKKNP